MIGDYGRDTAVFGRSRQYEGLNYYSGRAVLASDMNEEALLQTMQREAALVDVIGQVGVPKGGDGFQVFAVGNKLTVLPGDLYVQGARFRREMRVFVDRDQIVATPVDTDCIVVAQCTKTAEDYLLQPFLRDPGLGGPDTAGRRRPSHRFLIYPAQALATANGLTLAALYAKIAAGQTIQTPDSAPRDGRAAFSIDRDQVPDEDDCLIREDAAYGGRSNYNYRVEVHVGTADRTTIKWAREDIRGRIVQRDGAYWLQSLPMDDHRPIISGDTVEVASDADALANQPGVLGTITLNTDGSVGLSAEITAYLADANNTGILTVWQHPHAGNPDGIPVTDAPVALEKGVQVTLTGRHMPGDYWFCAARVLTGDILWPPVANPDDDMAVPAFNWGPHHAALAVVRRAASGAFSVLRDLRPRFPELTHLTADDVTVRDGGGCTFAGDTVQQALQDLCARIRDNSCSIKVRPDRIGEKSAELHPGWAALPTLTDALKMIGKVLADIDPAEGFGRDDVAEPFGRGFGIVFTAGEYVWPKDDLAFKDLTRVSLTACASAPVTVLSDHAIAFEHCLNVTIRDINLIFGAADQTLSITGGKSIRIDNVLIRRPVSDTAAAVMLAAARRIKVTDTRINLGGSKANKGVKPALHIWDAAAQTQLENVASNGALIVGPVLPKVGDLPTPALIGGAENNTISGGFTYASRKVWEMPSLSGATCRIIGCKFLAILPGADMCARLRDWADPAFKIGKTVFTVENIAAGVAMRLLRRTDVVGLAAARDRRPFAAANLAAVSVKAQEIPERVRAPFRHIDVCDTEILRGPSVLVGETLSLRNCRFPQWAGPATRAGADLTKPAGAMSGFVKTALASVVNHPDSEGNRRPWQPVCCLVARSASISGNQGNPSEMAIDGITLPLIVDFSPPRPQLALELDLIATLPEMLRNNIVLFHRKYLARG